MTWSCAITSQLKQTSHDCYSLVGSITLPMNSRQFVASWYMKKKNGLLTLKILGNEYGVMPIVVEAAAVVPVSSTSITALCSTFFFNRKK